MGLPERGPTFKWSLPVAAAGLEITEEGFERLLTNGSDANGLITERFVAIGWRLLPDGVSGYLLQDSGGFRFRLRVATDRLSLSPSVSRGAGRRYQHKNMANELAQICGFIVAWVNPRNLTAETFLLPTEYVRDYLKDRLHLLNDEWSGSAKPIIQVLRLLP